MVLLDGPAWRFFKFIFGFFSASSAQGMFFLATIEVQMTLCSKDVVGSYSTCVSAASPPL